jgi:nucleoside-diphosphate-sugar epimerase
MNILVIGCDQVGASLVRDLERIGHDISIIEKDSEQLKRLDAFDDYTFSGNALVGDPTRPPPAIQTFIILPHYTNGIGYLARERNTACSVRTVGQMVSSS